MLFRVSLSLTIFLRLLAYKVVWMFRAMCLQVIIDE